MIYEVVNLFRGNTHIANHHTSHYFEAQLDRSDGPFKLRVPFSKTNMKDQNQPKAGTKSSPASKIQAIQHTVEKRLLRECLSMAKFALGKGIKVPGSVMSVVGHYERMLGEGKLDPKEFKALFSQLNRVHTKLAELIYPIRPGTCHLIITQSEKSNFWHMFGAVPMARKMAMIAFFSMIAMLGISLSPAVSAENLSHGLLNNSGMVLLVNLIFLLSTASLGSSFALLFKINRELEDGGYEEDDDPSYISTWIMGMAAGMILAEVIPLDLIDAGGENGVTGTEMTKLILALLGGFASFMVYNILNTIVDALGSAFKKDGGEEKSKIAQQMKIEFAQQSSVRNLALINRLNQLSQTLQQGGDQDQAADHLNKMIQQLLDDDEMVEMPEEDS